MVTANGFTCLIFSLALPGSQGFPFPAGSELQETLLPTLSRLSAAGQANAFIPLNSRAMTPRRFRDVNPLSLTSFPALFPELSHDTLINLSPEARSIFNPPGSQSASPGTICCHHQPPRGMPVLVVTTKTSPTPCQSSSLPSTAPPQGVLVVGTLGTSSNTPHHPRFTAFCRNCPSMGFLVLQEGRREGHPHPHVPEEPTSATCLNQKGFLGSD